MSTDKQTTRSEHMAWCKQRALAETDPTDMLASMVSDVCKHPDTADLAELATLMGAMHASDPAGMRRFIEDFN